MSARSQSDQDGPALAIDMSGKTVLVTGGSRGVGRGIAERFLAAGADVVICGRNAPEKPPEARGRTAHFIAADVREVDQVDALVSGTTDRTGRLDVLVNNAGTTSFIPHPDLDAVKDEDWDRIMAVNVKGTFQCARAVRGPLEEAGEGEIINITSVAGLAGTGSSIPYCASKAAIINMTVTLARALAPKIRVNAVAPGFINGRWLKAGYGDAYEGAKAATEQRLPLGRVCEPEDIAEAILSLITGSDLVTGHVLPCEGGMLIA